VLVATSGEEAEFHRDRALFRGEGHAVSWGGAVLGAALVAIAVIDFRTYRIPDWLSLPLVAAGLAWSTLAEPQRWGAHLVGAALGYGSLAGFGALYFRLRRREGLGLGDAKLFAAGGAWLGWQALPLVLAVAAVAGLVFALATRRWLPTAPIAFGPWLALGIWLGWLVR
jgi:leader peptidase (prepilin peptidase)/N-methyltransferase